MLASLTLIERTDRQLVYSFSEVEGILDGRVVVPLDDIRNAAITEQPEHMENKMCSRKVFAKLLRMCLSGDYPEKVFYACG